MKMLMIVMLLQLVVTPPLISTSIFVTVIHMLVMMCIGCPDLAVVLLKLGESSSMCEISLVVYVRRSCLHVVMFTVDCSTFLLHIQTMQSIECNLFCLVYWQSFEMRLVTIVLTDIADAICFLLVGSSDLAAKSSVEVLISVWMQTITVAVSGAKFGVITG